MALCLELSQVLENHRRERNAQLTQHSWDSGGKRTPIHWASNPGEAPLALPDSELVQQSMGRKRARANESDGPSDEDLEVTEEEERGESKQGNRDGGELMVCCFE
ncbi:MAG: hypothetical protein M1830_000550 [Pleopsidium flavum]|nr:MAG: hypothetical protein M1830_000550 [Pleopsidium flavum]